MADNQQPSSDALKMAEARRVESLKLEYDFFKTLATFSLVAMGLLMTLRAAFESNSFRSNFSVIAFEFVVVIAGSLIKMRLSFLAMEVGVDRLEIPKLGIIPRVPLTLIYGLLNSIAGLFVGSLIHIITALAYLEQWNTANKH